MSTAPIETRKQSPGSSAEFLSEPVFAKDACQAARKSAFEIEYADWIAEQNAYVEAYGIPGADLRPW
jgi:hypothetical protein